MGSTDNPEAKRRYETLGYVDWGHGDFLITWDSIESNGNPRTASEIVISMRTPLEAALLHLLSPTEREHTSLNSLYNSLPE